MPTRTVARPETWVRAHRKSDGLPFYIVPGSTPGAAYYTTATACTCPSAQHSRTGTCKHQRAVAEHERRQRPVVAVKPRKTYEELFPACKGGCGDVADTRDGLCDRCASEREYEQRMAIKREVVARGTVKEAWL